MKLASSDNLVAKELFQLTQPILDRLVPTKDFSGSSSLILFPYSTSKLLLSSSSLVSWHLHQTTFFQIEASDYGRSIGSNLFPLFSKKELWIHAENPTIEEEKVFKEWVTKQFTLTANSKDTTVRDFFRSPIKELYGKYIVPQHRLDDFSHLLGQHFHTLHTSIFYRQDSISGDYYLFPTHGSAPDMAGLGIINPTAWILTVAMGLYLSECQEEAMSLVKALLLCRAQDPENRTPDEGGVLNSSNYIRNIVSLIH
jgi:hypothetical protein